MVKHIFSSTNPKRIAQRLFLPLSGREPRVRDPLIHVGIRKAASTYLQHCFSTQDNIRLASMERLENAIFDRTMSDEPTQPFLRQLKARFTPQWSRPPSPLRRHVVSNERFAINPRLMKFVPNDAEAPRVYDRFWTLTIGSLERLFPEARIVVVTRAPTSWVKSAYSQAVRGAIARHRFPAFVRAREQYLRENLNYRRMHKLFADAFGSDRVLFLPQELLRDDTDRFFGLLSDFAGFPIQARTQAETTPTAARNASPSERELDVLLNAWRFARLLDRHGRKDDSLFYRRYLNDGVEKMERVYKACYRNCVEFRSARGERLWQEMLDHLPATPQPVDCFDLPLDFADSLAEQSRFLLQRPGYEDHAAAYAPSGS